MKFNFDCDFNYFPFPWKETVVLLPPCSLCVLSCVSHFQLSNRLADFHETYYERYVIAI